MKQCTNCQSQTRSPHDLCFVCRDALLDNFQKESQTDSYYWADAHQRTRQRRPHDMLRHETLPSDEDVIRKIILHKLETGLWPSEFLDTNNPQRLGVSWQKARELESLIRSDIKGAPK